MKNKSSLIFTMVLTLLVIGAIAAMVIFKNNNNAEDASVDTSTIDSGDNTNQSAGPSKTKEIDVKGQPMLGKEEAKVTVVEFGDFKCPACKYFETSMKPELKKKYIDSGKVKFYFIHTPFHAEESLLGGLAGETVLKHEPEKYWDFHTALFELQPDNHNTEEKWLTMTAVKKALKTAGVKDMDTIVKDIKDTSEQKAVEKDIKLYEKHNITSTPTIIVDGKALTNPMDMNSVTDAIDKALK
ncbi:DsbA family protein [Macrococcoides caseolyticum]|uniref:DsbA family protein n=1 Tax=Macrococcoides caseolyticum TaxID=69966 RepID=UPI001F305BC3|nr:thioredoxin domain-containing protein [Macrococcus caseolyticus]MCE4956690.1 DsbA family protein [Macrococcus caseolyticus]